MHAALIKLLKTFHPDWEMKKIMSMIEREHLRRNNFADFELIEAELKRRNYNNDRIEKILARARLVFTTEDPDRKNGVLVRFVIAGIIEEVYNASARGEYLVEVLMGNAD